MTRPRGQGPRYSYRFHAFIAKLCEAAGVERELFYKEDPHPWSSYREKVKALVPELERIVHLKEVMRLSEIGYTIFTEADLKRAKNLEADAEKGRWLLEREMDLLEDMKLGHAVDRFVSELPARIEARKRIEELIKEISE